MFIIFRKIWDSGASTEESHIRLTKSGANSKSEIKSAKKKRVKRCRLREKVPKRNPIRTKRRKKMNEEKKRAGRGRGGSACERDKRERRGFEP